MRILTLSFLHIESIGVGVKEAMVFYFVIVESDDKVVVGKHVRIAQWHIRFYLDPHVEKYPESKNHLWVYQGHLAHNFTHEVVRIG